MITFDGFALSAVLDSQYEFPIEKFIFQSLQFSSNVMLHVPQGKLVLADHTGLLKRSPLGDSQSLKFSIRYPSVDGVVDTKFNMRIFRVMMNRVQTIDYYTILMTLDSPRFLNENSTSSINDTSKGTLKKLVEDSGLKFDFNGGQNDSDTNDKQVWIPRGDKRCVFSRRIIDAAWVNNTSCMQGSMDLDGTFYYRNLTDISVIKKQVYVLTPSSTQAKKSEVLVRIVDLKPFSKSGLANAISGYKVTTVEQNPTLGKSSNQVKHTKVDAAITTDSVAMNSNINNALSGSNTRFAPINCGNTHANYDKALHQNSRLLSMFSVGVHVVVDEFAPDLHLLDYVRVDTPTITTGTNTYDASTAGLYCVSGKSHMITQNGKLYTKYELLRQGTNNIEATSQYGVS